MTNRDVPDVLEWFKDFRETEYARSGFVATKDVILPKGPLKDFSHTIEPHLRRLGLPTTLDRGVINLIKEFQVCLNTKLCYIRVAFLLIFIRDLKFVVYYCSNQTTISTTTWKVK